MRNARRQEKGTAVTGVVLMLPGTSAGIARVCVIYRWLALQLWKIVEGSLEFGDRKHEQILHLQSLALSLQSLQRRRLQSVQMQ